MLRLTDSVTSALRRHPFFSRAAILLGAVLLIAGHGVFLYDVRVHMGLSGLARRANWLGSELHMKTSPATRSGSDSRITGVSLTILHPTSRIRLPDDPI